MQAVQLSRFGGPDVLEPVEIPAPVPGPGEAVVRVRAAGLNFFETLLRAGLYAATPALPMVPGVEVAGTLEAHGPDVTAPAIGTRVAVPLFALGRAGGYAEAVVAEAAALVPIPDALGFEDAAALMVQGLTALHLVRRSPPDGRTLLVHAAAGGVGSLLVQLARQAGARRILAGAGTPEKRDLAVALGADVGIDTGDAAWPGRVRAETEGRGADIVYDTVGGETTRAGLEALAPGGELVFAALGRFALDRAALDGLIARNQALRGFALLPLLSPGGLACDLALLFDRAARGELRVLRGGHYPLDRAAEAHRALESRSTVGKLVLAVG